MGAQLYGMKCLLADSALMQCQRLCVTQDTTSLAIQ
jgi:hypothetical protein